MDFPTLSTVASVAYSCDWLVRRLSSMCNTATRKVLAAANSGNAPSGNTGNITGSGGTASPVISRSTIKSYSGAPTSSIGGTSTMSSSGSAGTGLNAASNVANNAAKAAKMEIIEAKNTLINAVIVSLRFFCFILYSVITICPFSHFLGRNPRTVAHCRGVHCNAAGRTGGLLLLLSL